MKVTFFTLGCKVNQHETGAMEQAFFEHGYTICPNAEEADVFVVNSCTVTASGDKKSLQWLRRAKRRNPSAITILTGCYPQAFPEEASLAEADIIMGNVNRNAIFSYIDIFLTTGKKQVRILPHLPGEKFEELSMQHFDHHTRAFMKIQDGCNRRCAYCVIPRARGRIRSRELESILTETRVLAKAGYREIVYSGINLSCFGLDTKTSLISAMEAVAEIPELSHIRLGSLEPDLLSEDTLVRLSKIDKFCPQFHLSLQSGSDNTLRRMRRCYDTALCRHVIKRIRELFVNPSFTTDIIVGFPGETEDDFQESIDFVKECQLLKVHVFSYSPRSGTPAADMPEQIPNDVKSERNRRLTEAAEEVRLHIMQENLGTEAEVLLERPIEDGRFTGYTRNFVPVLLEAPGHKSGDIVHVTLTDIEDGRCRSVIKE